MRTIAGFVLAILMTAAALVRPWLTKPMLDDGLGLKKGSHGADYHLLLTNILVMAAGMLFGAITGALRDAYGRTRGEYCPRPARPRL